MDQKLNVLLVEDVEADAVLIEMELVRAGLECLVKRVEGAEEYLKELAEFSPDIILADYTLPQFSALEALRLLRESGSTLPFILVTGTNSEEVAVECMKRGADDYILKASLKRLPSAVLNATGKYQAERVREAAEETARRSKEQYRLITENSQDLICLLELDGNFRFASPAFEKVLGHQPSAILGTPFFGLVHGEDQTRLQDTLDEALFFRESRRLELRIRHQNDAYLMFESVVSVLFDSAGKPERTLIVSRDTSDQKQAEKAIRQLASFPRFNPNPVLEFAADGSLNYFNDAAMEMARSLKKNQPEALLPLNTSTIVNLALASGQNKLHVETPIAGRVLSWSFFPIVSNQVVHSYAEDITDRLNLEAQLRQAQKMDSIGQLAAGIAHDFNNILTIVQGHASLLLSDPSLGEDMAGSARQISLAAERAATLTRQLLMFSRKQVMQPQLLNLNDVISTVSQMLRSLVGEQVKVIEAPADRLPAIYADPGMIEQILVNLAVNARDAMPKGGDLKISTECIKIDEGYVQTHPEARAGYFVSLSVRDSGIGMDPSVLSHIFEPFFTTKDTGKGTGLGLATLYGIVKQHRGWVEVASKPGAGTLFRVYLPTACKQPAANKIAQPKIIPGGTETVLLVEDEIPLRELVQEILEKKGYRVLVAATGVEALRVWQRHRTEIDLLLTDMIMPEGVSGRELAGRMCADRPNLKVIFSSGYSLDVVNPEFNAQDGALFLQKPYDPETLTLTVRECLDRHAVSEFALG